MEHATSVSVTSGGPSISPSKERIACAAANNRSKGSQPSARNKGMGRQYVAVSTQSEHAKLVPHTLELLLGTSNFDPRCASREGKKMS